MAPGSLHINSIFYIFVSALQISVSLHLCVRKGKRRAVASSKTHNFGCSVSSMVRLEPLQLLIIYSCIPAEPWLCTIQLKICVSSCLRSVYSFMDANKPYLAMLLVSESKQTLYTEIFLNLLSKNYVS